MVCSLSKVKAGAEGYYASLAREDYYTKGGEPPGRWLGSGGEALKLSGEITGNDKRLTELFHGRNPNDGSELRKGAYHGKAVCAWDFTFSASKSVSVLWALSDEKTRRTIADCHEKAVTKAAKYLEENAVFTRTGKGGERREPLKPIFAAFQHSTSRELDPQLHTHLLLINTGIREDGKGGTVDGQALFKNRYGAQRVYSDTLQEQLTDRLKVSTQEVALKYGKTFEIVGVPKELSNEFSKRREQINKVLSQEDSSQERQVKVLATRKTKTYEVSREKLFSGWGKVGKEFGFDYRTCINHRQPRHEKVKSYRKKHSLLPDSVRRFINRHLKQINEERRKHARKRAERFKRKITVLYAIGRVDRSTYLRVTQGKGLPTTKFGIQFQYATYRISRKQRNYLLSKLERAEKEKLLRRAWKEERARKPQGKDDSKRSPAKRPEKAPEKQKGRERSFERERER